MIHHARPLSLNFVLSLYAGLFGAVFAVYQLGIVVLPESLGTIVGVISTALIGICVLGFYTTPLNWFVRTYVGLGMLNALNTSYFGVTTGTGVGLILSSLSGVIMMFMITLYGE